MLEDRLKTWIDSAPIVPPIIRRGRPGAWREELRLSDGRTLLIRPIDGADAEPLRQGFALLTAEEVRLRFQHPMRELSPELARQLCSPRPGQDFALVIAEDLPPGDALVGAVARAAIDAGTRRAEFAIIVSHFLSGKGLGRLLLRRLIRWARLKKLDQLYGYVLDDNEAMLALAATLGFRREHEAGEPGLTRIRLDLPPRSG